MAYRDFDAEAAERAREQDPIEFTLGGVRFTARPVCPFGAVLDLRAAPEIADDLEGAVAGMIAYFEQVVDDDQAGEVADAVRKVNAPQAYEVIRWLTEQYTGRPTMPSSDSAASPLPDGRGSSSEPNDTATAA